MPEDIPELFEVGELLTANALNTLQRELLKRLARHDHSGGPNAEQIDTPGLKDRSVTEPKLADAAVSADKLATDAVTARALADDAVRTEHIASGAVDTAAIADGAVTQDKLSGDVLDLLLRVGDGASSASQVIWRDPLVVYPPIGDIGVIAGILNPVEWNWPIAVISLDPGGIPVKMNPNIDITKTIERIDVAGLPPGKSAAISKQITDATADAARNLLASGGLSVTGGTGAATGVAHSDFGATGAIFSSGAVGAGHLGAGGFGAGGFGAGGFGVSEFGTEEFGASRFGSASPGSGGLGAGGTAPGLGNDGAAVRMFAMSTHTDPTPEPAVHSAPLSIAPNAAGASAAKRMTTIDTVDASGKPVDATSPDAITVGSGFSGQENFTKNGGSVDFRTLAGSNANALRDAAQAAGQMLFNLGIDEDFAADQSNGFDISKHIKLAFDGSDKFFETSNPLWGTSSWLPDILNRPELFGTGYSLSGGRNIQSVTRQFKPGNTSDHWVRVHFITPYRNASYAVNVTPRSNSDYTMISANIRSKTTLYVDIQFTGAQSKAGDKVSFARLSKLSFDLAIYGELGVPT